MKLYNLLVLSLLIMIPFITSCNHLQSTENEISKVKVGMMLVDHGIGDQSFNDSAFLGLMRARDELGIIFDYRDLTLADSYEHGLNELVSENELIIGLGFNMIEDFTKVAKENPHKSFLFIDGMIDLPNTTSITFKDEEGSFVVGVVAGLKSETNSIGFIGGMDIPVINRILEGFIAGVKKVNPQANVISMYAHDFGDSEKGREIAKEMIEVKDTDIIYVAAGFTGLGAIEEIVRSEKLAIGVDSDQFFLAEKAIITSMIKKIDVAVYTAIDKFIKGELGSEGHMALGLKEDGVGAAPIRVITLTTAEEEIVRSLTQQLIEGIITIYP